MGKNKNRGERGGQRRERGNAAVQSEEQAESRPSQEPMQSAGGFDQVTRKRQKRFGHN